MPKISIIYPTKRYGGIDILFECAKQQTFKDFEIIIVDSLYHERHKQILIFASDYDFAITHIPPKSSNKLVNIASAMNTGLLYMQGELMVEIQDFHVFPPETLEIFWELYQKNPKSLVSMEFENVKGVAVDHLDGLITLHYRPWIYRELTEDEKIITIPHGALRKQHQKLYTINGPMQYLLWEPDVASCPTELLRKINGWEEITDLGYGFENHTISLRAIYLSYTIYMCRKLTCYSFDHRQWCTDNIKDDPLKIEATQHNEGRISCLKELWESGRLPLRSVW